MRLHGYFRSSTTYRVRIALNLKGLAYDYIPVNLLKAEQRSPEFTELAPFQGLPLLEADGQRYSQSMAILAWLDERFPDRPLLPADPAQRKLARELAFAIATDIHGVNNLRTLNHLREQFGASDEQVAAWSRHWMETTLAPIEQQVPADDGFPFGAPTLFEVVLIPQVYNALRWKVDMRRYPKLLALYDHCLREEAFTRAAPEAQPDAP